MKKTLALVLSLVMLLAAMPMSVFAASDVLVDSVSIDIDTDLGGVSTADYDDFITINTPGLEFEDNYDDPGVFVKLPGFEKYPDTFVDGGKYVVMVCLSALEGYTLEDLYVDIPATVNGMETTAYCDCWWPTDDLEVYYYTFQFILTVGEGVEPYSIDADVPQDAPDAMTELDLTVAPTTSNKIGDWTDYITINTDNVDFDDDYGFPGVYVYDSETGDRLDERLYFVAGNTYDITVSVAPEEGSSFSYNLTVTINDEDADDVYISTYSPTEDESFELQYAEASIYSFTVEGTNSFGSLIHNFFVYLTNFFTNLFMPIPYSVDSCKTPATKR